MKGNFWTAQITAVFIRRRRLVALGMITPTGKVAAMILAVLWIGTIILVIDTRRNFPSRGTRAVDCPCSRLQSSDTRITTANASVATQTRNRTVVKWLRYCRHEKADIGPGRPQDAAPKQEDKKLPIWQMDKPKPKPQIPPKPKYHKKTPRNPHPYDFILKNSDACGKVTNAHGYVDALCLVRTPPSDSYTRSLIRKTWASQRFVKGRRILTMFLLGYKDEETQHLVELENSHFEDIIQEDFYDSYKNLTVKTLMGMKWAARYCPNAQYIMKVDTDMFVNVYNLVDRIDTAPSFNFVEGDLIGPTPTIRDVKSSKFVSLEAYPNKTYPPHHKGDAYLVSSDLSAKIFGNSLDQRFVPWEDAYIGILMHRMRMDMRDSSKYSRSLNYGNMQDTLRQISESIAVHLGEDKEENRDNMMMVWNFVRKLNDIPILDDEP